MSGKQSSSLLIQDPTDKFSYSTHEALLGATENAVQGGGMFSFVTQGGVKLLLEDDAFVDFLGRSKFDLVIGIDEITNPKALSALKTVSSNNTNLSVSAFLHEEKRSLFHPKFCWFKTENGGVLVVGSGNLTFSGLRNNWEAYTIVNLDEKEISELISNVTRWVNLHKDKLKPLDDQNVIDKAKKNVWKRKAAIVDEAEIKEQTVEEELELEEDLEAHEEVTFWNFRNSDEVLLAQIPKSGDRWRQANFDKNSFTDFFGAEPGNNNQRILLRNVMQKGLLDEVESRQSVSVKSENYRFELGAAAGLEYPEGNPPVGVFIKIAERVFMYCIVMPSDPSFESLTLLMREKWAGRADRMIRLTVNVGELEGSVRNLPFWKIKDN